MRRLLLIALVWAGTGMTEAQAPGLLRIRIIVADAEQRPAPVAGHVLLVSNDPPSAAPRAVTTGRDGTANVRLRPGRYIVESDRPVAFQGQVYQWTRRVEVAAGSETALDLTAANADADPLLSGATGAAAPRSDPSFLLSEWQASVVAVWTPLTRASGVVVDARGLIATSHRAIGTSTPVAVQLAPEVKVDARVIAADAGRDVAILWIDPDTAKAARPVPLNCGQPAPAMAADQDLFTIGAPLRGQKTLAFGAVTRVEGDRVTAEFRLSPGGAGGPVFVADGAFAGLTSAAAPEEEPYGRDFHVVRTDRVCETLAVAEQQVRDGAAPRGARLPVEPVIPFPEEALKAAVQKRVGSLSPPAMSSSDFDIAFITPVHTYAAQSRDVPGFSGTRSTTAGSADPLRALRDFAAWSDYVANVPPVLLVRVTPRLVEGFWARVARGAAQTQGVALPPIKRFAAGFSRLRAFCGDAEVTPVHPFILEQRVTDTEGIREGLYAYTPDALGPHCQSVRLVLYSESAPAKGDARVVDQKVLQPVWRDLALDGAK